MSALLLVFKSSPGMQGTRDLYLDCYTPRLVLVLLVFQCCVFLALFSNFFVRSYLISKPKKKSA
jgi:hypothetical protein